MSIKEKYSVKSIKPSETYDWLKNKHYAKRIPSISYAFGLYERSILSGYVPLVNHLFQVGKQNLRY